MMEFVEQSLWSSSKHPLSVLLETPNDICVTSRQVVSAIKLIRSLMRDNKVISPVF